MFSEDFEADILDPDKPLIEQFPEAWTYIECAEALTAMGLSSVPRWIRPVKTLSNGEKHRGEAALRFAQESDLIIIDEWTSVVDRTVGQIMSHTIQKNARRTNKRVVLLSCHYDILPWLAPDWVIDCNQQSYSGHYRKDWVKKNSNLTSEKMGRFCGPVLASITT